MTDVVEVGDTGLVEIDIGGIAGASLLEVDTEGPPGPAGPAGPTGPQGLQGPQGPAGSGTGGGSAIVEQGFASPATEWVITHTLGVRPIVETFDQNNHQIFGDVQTPDTATVIVSFFLPFAGTARLKG